MEAERAKNLEFKYWVSELMLWTEGVTLWWSTSLAYSKPEFHPSTIGRKERNQRKNFILFILFCVSQCLPAHMYEHHVHAWHLQRSEENIKFPRTGVTDDIELQNGFWKLNRGSL